jgi:hypothetical protein
MAFIDRYMGNSFDKFLVLSQGPTHTCKMSLVSVELFRCYDEYLASIVFVLFYGSKHMYEQ